ncbi:GTPase [Roseburia sp. NSJ-9]|jgi:putative membrane protein|uniref:GTPase n=2 Tax=Lachnospiraceae TaxID=186803 RepID=A0ABR7GD75_9FIRM|nr:MULTISPECIES: GTP-binding protein [Roseburia]MBC5685384.1 GTPase [Roseburia lenta]
MAEIPVYFFTGFMDSGKTTLIQETLFENGFAEDDDRILIIACEDGDVEYDTEKLKTINASVATIDTEAEFNTEHLQEIADQYRPDVVFVEYNGTWGVGEVYEMELPKNWVIVQSLATVDATTFEMYMANMRSMMMEQFFQAEVVIFNRCDDNTPKSKFRGNIKAVNRPAQIVYERADGTIDDREEELPFDINADVIEISDADYALWFMDCMENPKKYDGKKVHFLGLVYNPKDGKLKRGVIVPGRFAMTCCVEDITFLGMMCKTGMENTPEHRSWIDLTARIKVEFAREYKGKGPILYPIEMKPAEKPQDELVYFS